MWVISGLDKIVAFGLKKKKKKGLQHNKIISRVSSAGNG
jgi:hypothetical protein